MRKLLPDFAKLTAEEFAAWESAPRTCTGPWGER